MYVCVYVRERDRERVCVFSAIVKSILSCTYMYNFNKNGRCR